MTAGDDQRRKVRCKRFKGLGKNVGQQNVYGRAIHGRNGRGPDAWRDLVALGIVIRGSDGLGINVDRSRAGSTESKRSDRQDPEPQP